MSDGSVERLRGLYEVFNARDIEAMIPYFDSSIEFHSTFAAVGAVYHGHDGLRTWHRDIEEAWAGTIRLEPEAYFDLTEHTLAFGYIHGRGQQSGVEVAMPVAQVARWREHRIVFFKSYAHREDALRDLGVSEDELERIDP
jgi:SnoaL-like domain